MVDYASYDQYGPESKRNGPLEPGGLGIGCRCADCADNTDLKKRYRVHFDQNANQAEWEEEQYVICPPRVLGYSLGLKQWAQFQVSKLEEIPKAEQNEGWTERLKLSNENTKKLLYSLVTSHISANNKIKDDYEKLEVDDIVPGKGKGLVILLYGKRKQVLTKMEGKKLINVAGPPGVGKTSTAETIAVAARKPLFSVSVADVGTQAKHVEANLDKIFALATRWQAILLM
jgi:SpoVK/Ycf46/Vps4 family AAA+-type ATPase